MYRYRTHTCGELTSQGVGTSVRLSGWLHNRRDLGGLLFLDLRDYYSIVQLLVRPDSEWMEQLAHLPEETVLRIDGRVTLRRSENPKTALMTGGIEVEVDQTEVLGPAVELPFSVFPEEHVSEDKRLTYRFHLAAAGIGGLVITDGDTVEVSNLTRQTLFQESDVGRRRADAEAERLRARRADLDIETIAWRLDGPDLAAALASRSDPVLLSADRPADVHSWGNAACMAFPHPLKDRGGWKRTPRVLDWAYENFIVDDRFDESACTKVREDRYGNIHVRDVTTYHRTVSTYINTVFESGLRILKVVEPTPTSDIAEREPVIDDKSGRIPYFLGIVARKDQDA
jgi:hypothetical protein